MHTHTHSLYKCWMILVFEVVWDKIQRKTASANVWQPPPSSFLRFENGSRMFLKASMSSSTPTFHGKLLPFVLSLSLSLLLTAHMFLEQTPFERNILVNRIFLYCMIPTNMPLEPAKASNNSIHCCKHRRSAECCRP